MGWVDLTQYSSELGAQSLFLIYNNKNGEVMKALYMMTKDYVRPQTKMFRSKGKRNFILYKYYSLLVINIIMTNYRMV